MCPAGESATLPVLAEVRGQFPRVAIAHDWLTVPGGSEQVVLELLEMFPDAELFTSVYDPSPWPEKITARPVHSSFLGRIPGATRHYPKLLPLMNAAFRSFDLSAFDLVISSSHACAKNVRTAGHTLHVCYCHTPMRYAWEEGFLAGEEVGRATRMLLPPLLSRLRREDLAGASGPDVFVANSAHVAERIQRYYGRSAEVVHPPVDVEHYLGLQRRGRLHGSVGGIGSDGGGSEPPSARDGAAGHYLAFGRVVPYKRVDLAVEACAALGRPLDVAGGGRAMDAVRARAGAGTNFLGKVSEAERDELLRGARALLFPGEEDFGIVPVEAQAAGVPVIAFGVGGAAETVIDGRTGVLFDQQSAGGLAAAIERFEGLELDTAEIRENARRFGRERFQREMAGVIAGAHAALHPV